MSLLLQDVVVTSVALAVALRAVVRIVAWSRPHSAPACSNCNACAARTPTAK